MSEYFGQVSIFGPNDVVMLIIVIANWAFTAIHVYEEWKGETVPLWRNFGAIVGVWLPNWLGLLSFTAVLTLILWGVGLAGITGWLPFVGPLSMPLAVGALGAIIGARVSDTLVSHWSLYALGYRPNPGLRSTALYVLDAVIILLAFRTGLSLEPVAAWVGFGFGCAFFLLVLPAVWVLGVTNRSWQRARWVRGQSMPEWATDE